MGCRRTASWRRGTATDVGYVAYDGYGVEVARGDAAIGPAGSFTLQFDLPAGASTGIGVIVLDDGRGLEHDARADDRRVPPPGLRGHDVGRHRPLPAR